MRINYELSPAENVLALLTEANPGLSINSNQVTLGMPAASDAGEDDRNTAVTLTAVDGEGFSGSHSYYYKRLELATDAGAAAPDTSVDTTAATTEQQAIDIVLAELGLSAADVEASAYTAPVDDATPGSITLTAMSNSYYYIGSRVVVLTSTVENTDPLADAAPNQQLNGFDAENAPV